MRRNKIFAIRELERQDPAGFELINEGIRTNSTSFSVFDSPPHSPSISSSDSRGNYQTVCILEFSNLPCPAPKSPIKTFDLIFSISPSLLQLQGRVEVWPFRCRMSDFGFWIGSVCLDSDFSNTRV